MRIPSFSTGIPEARLLHFLEVPGKDNLLKQENPEAKTKPSFAEFDRCADEYAYVFVGGKWRGRAPGEKWRSIPAMLRAEAKAS